MKTCTKCKAEKPIDFFSSKSISRGLIKSQCKQCCNSYREEHYLKNRNEILARKAKYVSENAEKIRAQQALSYSNNKEKRRDWQAAYQASNPEKVLAKVRNRRARKLNAEGAHTIADVRRIFEHQRGLCANCHTKLFKSGKQTFHVDHITPLAKGGSNWPSNLQCLCPACNMNKSAKDPIEWANQNGKLL